MERCSPAVLRPREPRRPPPRVRNPPPPQPSLWAAPRHEPRPADGARQRPALQAPAGCRQTLARIHAARTARRDVHRGGDLRDGLRRSEPGAQEPRRAAGATGQAAAAADHDARARAGFRAARPATGAPAGRRQLSAGAAVQSISPAAAGAHSRRLDQPHGAAATRIAAGGLLLRERDAAARILDRPGSHSEQHDHQARPDDASEVGHAALHGSQPGLATAMAARNQHSGRDECGPDAALASDRGRNHAGDRGLGQGRARGGDRRVSSRALVPTRRRYDSAAPGRQRGIAMLVAILLVALGTILAAAIAYESAMSARRSTATFSFDEALLVDEGAEALAAYGLRAIRQQDKTGTINMA